LPTASHRPWLITGTIALALLGVGFIPISYEVGGPVTLKAKSGNLRTLSTPIAGVIDSLNSGVQAGSSVKKGQAIAQIRSRDLEREIAQTQQALAEAKQQLEEQQRRQVHATTDVQNAIVQNTALQQQAALANQLVQGEAPSQVQEIAANVHKQQVLLASADAKTTALRRSCARGRSASAKMGRGARRTQPNHWRNGSLAAIAGNHAAKAHPGCCFHSNSNWKTGNNYCCPTRCGSSRAAHSGNGRSYCQFEPTLATVGARSPQSTLRAPIDGVIITEGFDLKVGKELKPDQDLLEVVNVRDGLVGSVEIEEQDSKAVQVGKNVRFRLSNDKLKGFDARVEQVIPNVKTDQTGQKRTLSVLISVTNQDEQLRNGSSGYAYIHSEQIPLYQRVRQEISASSPGSGCNGKNQASLITFNMVVKEACRNLDHRLSICPKLNNFSRPRFTSKRIEKDF
jgi:multidrug resistance efflux pump